MSHENNSKNDEEEDDLGGAAVSYIKECCHLNFLVEMLLVILLQYWEDQHLIGTK